MLHQRQQGGLFYNFPLNWWGQVLHRWGFDPLNVFQRIEQQREEIAYWKEQYRRMSDDVQFYYNRMSEVYEELDEYKTAELERKVRNGERP